MTIELRQTENDVLLPVHAQPGSRRNEIVGEHDGRLKIAVTQVAEKGKANKAILKLLAKELGLSKPRLEITIGETASRKTVRISNVSIRNMSDRIQSLVENR